MLNDTSMSQLYMLLKKAILKGISSKTCLMFVCACYVLSLYVDQFGKSDFKYIWEEFWNMQFAYNRAVQLTGH